MSYLNFYKDYNLVKSDKLYNVSNEGILSSIVEFCKLIIDKIMQLLRKVGNFISTLFKFTAKRMKRFTPDDHKFMANLFKRILESNYKLGLESNYKKITGFSDADGTTVMTLFDQLLSDVLRDKSTLSNRDLFLYVYISARDVELNKRSVIDYGNLVLKVINTISDSNIFLNTNIDEELNINNIFKVLVKFNTKEYFSKLSVVGGTTHLSNNEPIANLTGQFYNVCLKYPASNLLADGIRDVLEKSLSTQLTNVKDVRDNIIMTFWRAAANGFKEMNEYGTALDKMIKNVTTSFQNNRSKIDKVLNDNLDSQIIIPTMRSIEALVNNFSKFAMIVNGAIDYFTKMYEKFHNVATETNTVLDASKSILSSTPTIEFENRRC